MINVCYDSVIFLGEKSQVVRAYKETSIAETDSNSITFLKPPIGILHASDHYLIRQTKENFLISVLIDFF